MRRGATVVEMAVVAPVLVLMMVGFLEVGNAFMVKQSLNLAANRAARVATLPGYTFADVKGMADEVLGKTGLKGYTVKSNIDDLGPTDRAVTVEISVPFDRVLFTGNMLGGKKFTLTSTKTSHREIDPNFAAQN